MEVKSRGALALEERGAIDSVGAVLTIPNRFSRILGWVIFYALLALITFVAIPYGTIEPWWTALFECIVFALGALWVIEGLFSGSWLRREHRLLVPLLALVVFAFVQTMPLWKGSIGTGIENAGWQAISADPYGTRLVVLKLLAYILALGLLLRYTNNQRRLRALIYLVVGVAVASALFGMVRQTTQREPGFILPRLIVDSGYGQFINYNHFAFLMEMGLGLLLGLVVAGVRRERKLIYLALALPMWTALVLSNSRGGIFSMLSQLVFIALLWTHVQPKRETATQTSSGWDWILKLSRSILGRAVIIGGLVITVFIGMVWMGGARLVNRIGANDEVTAEGHLGRDSTRRMEIWRSTWQIVKASPLTGVGFGAYWVTIDQYNDRSGKRKPYQAHNDYLDILASGGLIGVTLAGWFLFAVIKRARERLHSTDSFRRGACFGALIGLFGVAVHSLVDFGLQKITVNALVFIALIVIAIVDIPATAQRDQSLERAADGHA